MKFIFNFADNYTKQLKINLNIFRKLIIYYIKLTSLTFFMNLINKLKKFSNIFYNNFFIILLTFIYSYNIIDFFYMVVSINHLYGTIIRDDFEETRDYHEDPDPISHDNIFEETRDYDESGENCIPLNPTDPNPFSLDHMFDENSIPHNQDPNPYSLEKRFEEYNNNIKQDTTYNNDNNIKQDTTYNNTKKKENTNKENTKNKIMTIKKKENTNKENTKNKIMTIKKKENTNKLYKSNIINSKMSMFSNKTQLKLCLSTSACYGTNEITKAIPMFIEPNNYDNKGYNGGLLKETMQPTLIKKPKVDSLNITYTQTVIDSINILQKKPYKIHDAANYYQPYQSKYKIKSMEDQLDVLSYFFCKIHSFDKSMFYFSIEDFNLDKCIATANADIIIENENNKKSNILVNRTTQYFSQILKENNYNFDFHLITQFVSIYIKKQRSFHILHKNYIELIILDSDFSLLEFLIKYNKEFWTKSIYDYRGRNYPSSYNISRSTNYKHYLVNTTRKKCTYNGKKAFWSYLIILFNKTTLKEEFTNINNYMHFVNSKNVLHQLKGFNISDVHFKIFEILENNNCLKIFSQQDVYFYLYFHEYLIVLLGLPTNINIDIDHVNSGPCYMATLVSDSYTLKLCNVNTNSKKSYDLYKVASVQIYKCLSNKNKIQSIIKTFNKKHPENISQNILKYKSLLNPNILLNRSIGKALIQPRLYGSSYESFRKTFKEKNNELIKEIPKLKNKILKEENKSKKIKKLEILKSLIIFRNNNNYDYNLNIFIKEYIFENKNKKIILLLSNYSKEFYIKNNKTYKNLNQTKKKEKLEQFSYENLLKTLLKNYLYKNLNKCYKLKIELYVKYEDNIIQKLDLKMKSAIKLFENQLVFILNSKNEETIIKFLNENYETIKNKDFSEITRLIWFVSNQVKASNIINITTKKLKQLLQHILYKAEIGINQIFKLITPDFFVITYNFTDKKIHIKEILKSIIPDYIHSLDGMNIRLLMILSNSLLDKKNKNYNEIPEPSHDGSRSNPNNIYLNRKLHIIAYAYAFSIDLVTEDHFIKIVETDYITKKNAKIIYKELSNAFSSYNAIKTTNYLKDLDVKTKDYKDCLNIIHPVIYYSVIYANKDLLDKQALIQLGKFLIELKLMHESIENLTFENLYLNSSKMFIIKA